MSRTDIGAPSLAKWLRRVAGDGRVEWVTTPMHSNVLLDMADLLDENAKLRELLGDALKTLFYKRFDGSVGCTENCPRWQFSKDCQMVDGCWLEFEAAELGIKVEV